MDLVELQRKLLAAARRQLPSDGVPYAFTERIMARVRGLPQEDNWVLWGKALWHAALGSLALSVLLSVWLLLPGRPQAGPSNLSQLYDSTLYAASEQLGDSW